MRFERAALPLCAAPLLLAASAAWAAEGFVPAAPGYAWSFPRDHFAHPAYRNEWWYFTGQLEAEGEPGELLGYQLTFFRVGLLPERPPLDSPWAASELVMGHAAVTDPAAKAHVFSEVLWRAVPLLSGVGAPPGPVIAWAQAPPGTDARWALELLPGGAFRLTVKDDARGLAYDLTARPEKPIVFQGPGGLSRKAAAEGFASLYYSVTRLVTAGSVTVGGRTRRVRGTSWLDREFGSSQLAPSQVGWDWFALQLADGRDLMLYLLRRADGSLDFARATVVSPSGEARWLGAEDFTVRATEAWRSDATKAVYPSRWKVTIPSERLELTVVPALADQENRAALAGGVFYWEGMVTVRDAAGTPAGRGYVELTGYGPGSRPPI